MLKISYKTNKILLTLSLLFFTVSMQSQTKCYKDLETALANKNCVECLDLSKKKLREIPSEIYEFPHLKKIILNKNKIKHIPDSLSSLTNLHYLDFSSNYIEALPNSLSTLNIDTLIMWDNPIYEFPKEFDKWNLKYLDLRAIQMNKEEQKNIKALFPSARIRMDHPCNCGR